MQGRDDRSVRVLVPDPRVLDNGFHDATIIDMGDMAEPAVSEDDLSLLQRQWPVSVIQSMTWMQSELDDMQASAKKCYRHSRLGACTYCGHQVHQVRHVSPCVKLSLRFRTVVALSGVVVHGMERYATRLYGVRFGRCPSTVPLRYLDRCAPVQRDPPVAGASLQGVS